MGNKKLTFDQRVTGTLFGILIGAVLFFGSFVVLYENEGILKFANVIDDSVELQFYQSDAEGVILHTGILSADIPISSDEAYISGGNFMFLEREVEIYAWEEKTKETDDETIYYYEKKWVDKPKASYRFKEPEGHRNEQKTISNYKWYAEGVFIGNFPIGDVRTILLHNAEQLNLRDVFVLQGESTHDEYIFISRDGESRPQAPEIGDHRISYQAVMLGDKTTFVGGLRDGSLSAFPLFDDNELSFVATVISSFFRSDQVANAFDLFEGDREDAREFAKNEDKKRLWIFRIVGFLMMFIGLFMLVVKPLTVLLYIIPVLGSVSRFILGLVSLFIALLLTFLTIIISIIFHNPIALIITILLVMIGIVYFFIYREKVNPTKKDDKEDNKKDDSDGPTPPQSPPSTPPNANAYQPHPPAPHTQPKAYNQHHTSQYQAHPPYYPPTPQSKSKIPFVSAIQNFLGRLKYLASPHHPPHHHPPHYHHNPHHHYPPSYPPHTHHHTHPPHHSHPQAPTSPKTPHTKSPYSPHASPNNKHNANHQQPPKDNV